MQFKNYTSLIGLLLFSLQMFGQQTGPKWCGYKEHSAWLDWYQRNTSLFGQDGGSDTTWLYVPMTLHIVGTDTETGYYPFDEALRAVKEMNEQYAPLHVRFFLKSDDPVQYHPNSSWYKHDWTGGSDMINTTTAGIHDRLNAFIVMDPAGNCGYSWQDAIVLGKGCSGSGNSTWAHEAGHHFSLPHTFDGWEDLKWDYSKPAPNTVNGRGVEKTDRSNCYNAGDGFCDTDPDYLNSRWQCGNDGRSTTPQLDPNNQSFRSDGSLFMGYANDACATRFSPEQMDAIRANLQSEHSKYLKIKSSMIDIDDDAQVELISPIDTNEVVQFNHIELKWNSVPNAKYYVVEVSNSKYFNAKLIHQTVINQTSLLVTKGVPNNFILYWRVSAYNDWDLAQPNDKAQIGRFRTQNLLATNDLERSAIIELAPNPVQAGVPAQLKISSNETMDLSVKVCDAAGRLCFQHQDRLYTGDNTVELPTANLGAGAYSIFLQNEKGATVRRLVVVQ